MNDATGRTDIDTPDTPAANRAPADRSIAGRASVNGEQQVESGADGRARQAPQVRDGAAEPVARRTVVETGTQPRLDTRQLVLLAGAAAGVLILIALGLYWRANLGLVKTDNAQTTGDLSPISSRIPGTVVKVDVIENTHVMPGQPLVELDPSDYRVALAQAQANLTAAQAQVRALQAALGAQQAQYTTGLEAAQAHEQATQPTVSQAQAQLDLQDRTTAAQLAQARSQVSTAAAAVTAARIASDTVAKTLSRDRQLLAQGAIAQQQVDTDESAAEQARAQYQAAQDALAQARSNVLAAQAARQQVVIARNAIAVNQGELSNAQALVQQAAAGATLVQQRAQELAQAEAQAGQAEQAVLMARLNLDRTIIRAPAEGRVTNRTVEVGQVVAPNQPLLSLTLPGVWVVANIKETQLGGIRPGQPVRIRIDTYHGRTYHGTVESIGSATGSTTALLPPDNATGNFVKVVQLVPVRITLDPAELRRDPLPVGLSAEVSINTRSHGR
jgi:membrane fusion protein, multidrug efflux system